MGSTQKGIGCLALILLVIVVAFIFTKNSPEVPSDNQGSSSSDSSIITDDSAKVPNGTSQLSGLINFPTEPAPTTSLASTISTLSGIFRLNLSKEELVQLEDELSEDGSSESSWAGLGTVGCALSPPVTIDRYNGETLVLAGSEWSDRSQNQQDSMVIDLYPAALLGYGNRSMPEDVNMANIATISGIDVSSVSKTPDALNDALKGTGIKVLHCKQENEDRYYLLADSYEQAMGYSVLDGAPDTDTSFSMSHPCFIYQEDAPIAAPVQITTDGYFTIDISSIPSGYYVIDGLMGNIALIII